jgi:uncharacterized protein
LSLNARSYLVDAGILFLFYSGSLQARTYLNRIFSARALGFVSEINLAEFYYKTVEKFGKQTAEVWYLQTRQSLLRAVAPDMVITRNAALWKVKRRDISLADCYALATMQEKAQVLLTSDPVLGDMKEINVIHISANK